MTVRLTRCSVHRLGQMLLHRDRAWGVYTHTDCVMTAWESAQAQINLSRAMLATLTVLFARISPTPGIPNPPLQ